MNNRPVYFDEGESVIFERTPKHVIYSLMRDYAFQLFGEDGSAIDTLLVDLPQRIQILKDNNLIKEAK